MGAFSVHEMPTLRQKMRVVSALRAFDAACLRVFGIALGWI